MTYIAADCQLNGDLQISSDCMIDGTIFGSLSVQGSVTIDQQGVVDGHLEADEVRVSGQFKGKLKCKRLSISANGLVDGEVMSDKIEIFDGGQFIGSRAREPMTDNLLVEKEPELA
ncbi:polymer-forming cytoskeletal protein [uncultured Ferrimonas sp.]|uniref:bactofilin family protein n=1 Tax=uncultured Ferrimonas sp. TaxID=432640 RepID=UPI0026111B2B|nr:polymer-forming cytoskeletal protein [uncultured Ferrimonas sp.]